MAVREFGEESGTPTAAAEPAVANKPVSEKPEDAGSRSEDTPTGTEGESPKGGEVSPEKAGESARGEDASKEGFYVGTYRTKEDAERGFQEKETAMSREQQKASSAQNIANRMRQQLEPYYDLDESGNIIGARTPQQPQKSREELMEAASLGDKDSMGELLRVTQQETLQAVQSMTNHDRLRAKTVEKYPDLKNPNSALYRETDAIMRTNPRLANVESIEFVTELAQKRLLERELPHIKQRTINQAHQRIAGKGANTVENPATSIPGGEESLSTLLGTEADEKIAFIKKMGVDPGRVATRLKESKGGRYL